MLEVNFHSVILISDKGVVFYIILELCMYLLYVNSYSKVSIVMLKYNFVFRLSVGSYLCRFFILHFLKYMEFSQ